LGETVYTLHVTLTPSATALAEHELRSVSPALQPILKGEFDAFLEQHAGYSWPGNVRELTKVVHSLALGITPHLSGAAPARADVPEEAGRWSLREVRQEWKGAHGTEGPAPTR